MSDDQLRVFGHFNHIGDQDAGNPFTRILPSVSEVLELRARGDRFVYSAFWASNLDEKTVQKGLRHVENSSPFFMKFNIFKLDEAETSFPAAFSYFKKSRVLRVHHQSSFLAGNHLRILLSTACDGCSEGPMQKVGRSIALRVNLIFGPAAFRLVNDGTYDINLDRSSHTTDEKYCFNEDVDVGAIGPR